MKEKIVEQIQLTAIFSKIERKTVSRFWKKRIPCEKQVKRIYNSIRRVEKFENGFNCLCGLMSRGRAPSRA